MRTLSAALLVAAISLPLIAADPLKQEPNTWLKRSPVKDGPPSPGVSLTHAVLLRGPII